MTSELDIWLAGVDFVRDTATGRLRPVGPPGTNLREAVAERASVVRARLFGGPPHPDARRGRCDACGEAMALDCRGTACRRGRKVEGCYVETPGPDGTVVARPRPALERWTTHGKASNRGGTCWLCECAIQKVIDAGEWPRTTRGTSAVPDRSTPEWEAWVEEMIERLPPKPKAPWETG